MCVIISMNQIQLCVGFQDAVYVLYAVEINEETNEETNELSFAERLANIISNEINRDLDFSGNIQIELGIEN